MNDKLMQSVNEFRKGSRDAFDRLVRHFQNLVTSVAFSQVGDLHRSEDLAQQAFLVAWEKQRELEQPEKFGSWICAITRNLARNEQRLIRNRKPHYSFDDQKLSDPTNPEFRSIRQEQSDLLWATLKNIPEKYREPMILFLSRAEFGKNGRRLVRAFRRCCQTATSAGSVDVEAGDRNAGRKITCRIYS